VSPTERPSSEYCASCGYNVRGLPRAADCCPECGLALDLAKTREYRRMPRIAYALVVAYAVIPLWLALSMIPYCVNGRVWFDRGVVEGPPVGSVGQLDDPNNTPPFNWPIVGQVWYWVAESSVLGCMATPFQIGFGVWLFLWLANWDKRLPRGSANAFSRAWCALTLLYVCELLFGRRALSWLSD
jgi:hypothetical protein